MMPLYRVKISWTSDQQLQSWQSSLVNVWYDTAKKPADLVEYLRTYWTDFHNLFTILMKAIWVQRMDLYLIFRLVKGCCHGNQIILGKRESNESGLTPRAFVALAFENELKYHSLYVHINSNDDQASSGIDLGASDQYLQSSRRRSAIR